MNIFYLTFIIIGLAVQNVIKKPYTDKTGGKGVYFFSAMTALAAMLFFVASAIIGKGNLNFDWGILPYAIGFAVSYAIGTIFSVVAVSCGSLSLTSLIIQYSLMIPTVYGIFVLNDPISSGLVLGIILLVISLILINKKDENIKFSLKWIVSVLLAFLGNGLCSVFQKMQQVEFDGQYKDEFMIIALFIVIAVIVFLMIIKEKEQIGLYVKNGWHFGLVCGIMNGMVNLFVMILSGLMPVSLMFPLISAGGIIVTYIVSKFFYKESLSNAQFVGFILGIGSVVLLNI